MLSAAVAFLGWFSALAPYELSLDVGSLRHEVRLARVIPFGPTIGHETVITDPLLCGAEVAAALVLGGLFSLALREWSRSGWARILGAGVAVGGLSVFMEACQLFVVGRRDVMTPPRAAKQLQERISGARTVEIGPSGHALMAEAPDATLDALIDFLS